MPTLSHSSMDLFGQCGRKYLHTKREKRPQAPSGALVLGDAVHQTLELIGGHKRLGEPLPHALEIEAAFLDAFAERLDQDDPGGACIVKPEADALIARGLATVRTFLASVEPHFQPVAVEELFTVEIPGLPDWQFTGRVDARTQAAQPDGEVWDTIVDYKATGKPWAAGAEHAKDQAAAYLWADQLSRREPPARQVTFVVLSSQTPRGWAVESDEEIHVQVEIRRTTRTPEQIGCYASNVHQVARAIAREEFTPNPGPLCGWCTFASGPAGGGGDPVCALGAAWLASRGRQVQPEIARFWATRE